MTILPRLWARPSFSPAEVAELVGVPSATLRSWLTRCNSPNHLGQRARGRVELSGADAFYYEIVHILTVIGVGVRQAMALAEPLVADDALPANLFLLVERHGEEAATRLADNIAVSDRTCTVIPIRKTALDMIERASAIYGRPTA